MSVDWEDLVLSAPLGEKKLVYLNFSAPTCLV